MLGLTAGREENRRQTSRLIDQRADVTDPRSHRVAIIWLRRAFGCEKKEERDLSTD